MSTPPVPNLDNATYTPCKSMFLNPFFMPGRQSNNSTTLVKKKVILQTYSYTNLNITNHHALFKGYKLIMPVVRYV